MNSKIPAFVSSLTLTILVADDTVRKTHPDQIVQDDKKTYARLSTNMFHGVNLSTDSFI